MIIYATCRREEEYYQVDGYWGDWGEEIDKYFLKKEDALSNIKKAEENYRNLFHVDHQPEETIVWLTPDLRTAHYIKEIVVH